MGPPLRGGNTKTNRILSEAQKVAHQGSFEYIAATATTVWSEEEFHIYGLDPAGPSPSYDVMLAGCIHPDDRELLHEAFTNAVRNKSMYELEHRIVRPERLPLLILLRMPGNTPARTRMRISRLGCRQRKMETFTLFVTMDPDLT